MARFTDRLIAEDPVRLVEASARSRQPIVPAGVSEEMKIAAQAALADKALAAQMVQAREVRAERMAEREHSDKLSTLNLMTQLQEAQRTRDFTKGENEAERAARLEAARIQANSMEKYLNVLGGNRNRATEAKDPVHVIRQKRQVGAMILNERLRAMGVAPNTPFTSLPATFQARIIALKEKQGDPLELVFDPVRSVFLDPDTAGWFLKPGATVVPTSPDANTLGGQTAVAPVAGAGWFARNIWNPLTGQTTRRAAEVAGRAIVPLAPGVAATNAPPTAATNAPPTVVAPPDSGFRLPQNFLGNYVPPGAAMTNALPRFVRVRDLTSGEEKQMLLETAQQLDQQFPGMIRIFP